MQNPPDNMLVSCKRLRMSGDGGDTKTPGRLIFARFRGGPGSGKPSHTGRALAAGHHAGQQVGRAHVFRRSLSRLHSRVKRASTLRCISPFCLTTTGWSDSTFHAV
ncbi:hypothetical protein MRX96_059604 [Rhipicephalus microplus]